ncbi:5570_t:CDS:2, partial [Cetraspora pellucida]
MLDAIISKIFGFTKFKPKQKDSINCFIEENDTLYILPMGEGKTLVYTALALLFTGLTQKLINKDIPLAILYTSSEQLYNFQEAIFSEISLGFIQIPLVTSEKYIKNLAF